MTFTRPETACDPVSPALCHTFSSQVFFPRLLLISVLSWSPRDSLPVSKGLCVPHLQSHHAFQRLSHVDDTQIHFTPAPAFLTPPRGCEGLVDLTQARLSHLGKRFQIGMVVHAYNPSYLGGLWQEDCLGPEI